MLITAQAIATHQKFHRHVISINKGYPCLIKLLQNTYRSQKFGALPIPLTKLLKKYRVIQFQQ